MSKHDLNLKLLQRPHRVRANTKTPYIYSPKLFTENSKLEPGDAIQVKEVHKGDHNTLLTVVRWGTRYDKDPERYSVLLTDIGK